jgi:hypothetical protein
MSQASPSELSNALDSSPWLDRQGVADHFGITPATVDNWSNAGILTKHRIGRVVRFHRNEVDAALMGAAQ